MRQGTPDERFDRRVLPTEGDGCWPWRGKPTRYGYARFRVGTRNMMAHRFALERHLGRSLRAGFFALHTCDNRVCCRPSHLYEGTRLDNAHDRDSRNRGARSPGEANPNAKLTWALVDEIRALLPTASVRSIARRFGVSRPVIAGIRDGRNWRRHADLPLQ